MEGDMAAPTDVNNDNKFEILNTSSQLEIVSPIFSDSTGIILLRTSGLVRASRTLSVMFFLDTGVFLLVL
jgi:hypothetical protein